jgi:tight adherence protein C
MSPDLDTLLPAAGTALIAIVFLALAVRQHSRHRRALEAAREAESAAEGAAPSAAGAGVRRLGALFKPKDEHEIEALKSRVVRAGLGSRDAVELYLTIRWSVVLFGLIATGVLATTLSEPEHIAIAFIGITSLTLLGPGAWLDMRTRRRQRAIGGSLPSTLDLLVTCLEAGLGLEQALERVSAESRSGDDLLAAELRVTLAELKAGLPMAIVFRRFAARVGIEDINTLAAVITQAATLGTNITDVLRNHAASIRRHRMLELEEKAGKANAKLTLPLTMCLLPAVLVLLLGPAAIMMLRSL